MEEVRDSLYFGFRGNYFPLKPLCLSLSSLISYLMTCTGMKMKSSSTVFREKIQFGKVERCINMGRRPVHFILSTLFIATIFSIFLLYSPNPLYLISKQGLEQQASSPMQGHKSHQKRESCDLSKGHWVRESRGSFFYTNSSCATIPESKNCFKQGRMDMDFLNWRWKPDQCDLPRFNAKTFLQIVQGKTMAFIGDSVARNHIESLLCLLSQEEIPEGIYKDSEDRFRTWYFRRSNFTLKVLWTKFLIAGEERMINGTGSSIFDLQLDKVDDGWANHLPGVDYAIVSAGHWFFRVMYLHEGDNVVGCVYCNEPNVTSRNVDFALQMSFRATFNYINGCKNCSGLVTLLRTFAPAHFDNGAWNTGGYCNRTGPFNETEIDLTSSEWQMRNAQVKEIKRARKFGENQGKRFGVVDVTRAMLMRPDGHPGEHWGNKWKRGYNDCVHWCMPGPVDTWSEIFMAVLRKEAGLSSLYRVAAN